MRTKRHNAPVKKLKKSRAKPTAKAREVAARRNTARIKAEVEAAAAKVKAIADEAFRVSDEAARVAEEAAKVTAELAERPRSFWRW